MGRRRHSGQREQKYANHPSSGEGNKLELGLGTGKPFRNLCFLYRNVSTTQAMVHRGVIVRQM